MIRARRSRSRSAPVSLFPFLAVLVSTMGALIFLLLAINRQVSLQALASAVSRIMERASGEEQSLNAQRRDLETRVAKLEHQLDSVEAARRAIDQQLAQSSRESRDRAERLEAARHEARQLANRRAEIEREIESIRQQIDELERERARFAAEQLQADRTFTPVVHPGTHGTNRHPIYIECRSDAIVLQPEGIELTPQMVAPSADGISPLARAVRALAKFHADSATQQSDSSAKTQPDPYPLMLVRPNGIGAYYAARQAIEPLAVPFGYELVEADWNLRYPPADAEARRIAIAALHEPPGSGSHSRALAGSGKNGSGGTSGHSSLLGPIGSELTGLLRAGAGMAPTPSNSGPGPGSQAGSIANSRSAPPHAGGNPPIASSSNAGTQTGAESESREASVVAQQRRAGNDQPPETNEEQTPQSAEPQSRDAVLSQTPTSQPHTTETRTDDLKPQAEPNLARDTATAGSEEPAEGDPDDTTRGRSEPRLPGSRSLGNRIPVPRRIRVMCRGNELIVGSRETRITVPRSGPLDEFRALLQDAIDNEVASWGPAGMTFDWSPQLDCRVYPSSLDSVYAVRLATAGKLPVEHVIMLDATLDLGDSLFLRSVRLDAPRAVE